MADVRLGRVRLDSRLSVEVLWVEGWFTPFFLFMGLETGYAHPSPEYEKNFKRYDNCKL